MERWKKESPIRIDYEGEIDGVDMKTNIVYIKLDPPHSIKGLQIGEKVTLSLSL